MWKFQLNKTWINRKLTMCNKQILLQVDETRKFTLEKIDDIYK